MLRAVMGAVAVKVFLGKNRREIIITGTQVTMEFSSIGNTGAQEASAEGREHENIELGTGREVGQEAVDVRRDRCDGWFGLWVARIRCEGMGTRWIRFGGVRLRGDFRRRIRTTMKKKKMMMMKLSTMKKK